MPTTILATFTMTATGFYCLFNGEITAAAICLSAVYIGTLLIIHNDEKR